MAAGPLRVRAARLCGLPWQAMAARALPIPRLRGGDQAGFCAGEFQAGYFIRVRAP